MVIQSERVSILKSPFYNVGRLELKSNNKTLEPQKDVKKKTSSTVSKESSFSVRIEKVFGRSTLPLSFSVLLQSHYSDRESSVVSDY